MAYFLKGKNQRFYSKHSNRASDRNSTNGQRNYSRAWLNGFHSLWDNDGIHDISRCKSSFEKTAFNRGRNFAKKVIDE